MFWNQIAKTLTLSLRKSPILRFAASKIDPDSDRSISRASTIVNDFEEADPKPFSPANNARESEDSLHFSC
jgi:hypothetical protein